ncbi:MAG: sensor histidine kinase [Acidimicrobiales bacterium]
MEKWRRLWNDKPWSFPLGVGIVALLTVIGAYVESYPRHHYAGLHLTFHPPLVAFAIPLLGALSLGLMRTRTEVVFFATVLAALSWAALGQLSGAILVPLLVSLFWFAQHHSLRIVAWSSFAGAAALWVVNGAMGPFGWFGGPGLTLWPEIAAAAAFGSVVSARRLAQREAIGRRLESERARAEEVHLIIDRERMRIARELHDVVAHTMALINIQASAALLLMDHDPGAASNAVSEIRSASKTGLGELRSILSVMRPQNEEESLHEVVPDFDAIQRLITDWNTAGIATTLEVVGTRRALPTAVALASFRIVQEALTNVARHATQPTTTAALSYCPDSLTIDIRNTSRTTRSTHQGGTGTGLIGMEERVRSLAGQFSAQPIQGGGFHLRVVLPLPPVPTEEHSERVAEREITDHDTAAERECQ